MYEVELFHQFSSRILHNVCPDGQTDSVDQNQTVQYDVEFTLSVNLLEYIFVKNTI